MFREQVRSVALTCLANGLAWMELRRVLGMSEVTFALPFLPHPRAFTEGPLTRVCCSCG